jgi:hypothetical protein
VSGLITASVPSWTAPFTGLSPSQRLGSCGSQPLKFDKLDSRERYAVGYGIDASRGRVAAARYEKPVITAIDE